MSMKIKVSPRVEAIVMPENLRVGLTVKEARQKCLPDCHDEFALFALGQSPFHVPPPLAEALAQNAHKGHYSAAEGVRELREAVAGFNKRHFGMDVSPERIIIGPGTKDLLFSVFSMISGSVIIPAPSWIGYYPQIRLLGKQYHPYRLRPRHGYKIQPDELDDFLLKLAHERSQHLLIINNPHNPTGALYSREELERIVEVCRRNNTLILADEIYALTTYNIEDFTSIGLIYPEGTFVTNGLSKDRSAGGYRLGTCILPDQGNEELFKDFTKIAATVYTNVSTPTQFAAVKAYEPNEEIEEYFIVTRDIHRLMGTYLSGALADIAGVKATTLKGAFYCYANFNELKERMKSKGIDNSNQLSKALIAHPFHVAVVSGDSVMADPNDYCARLAFVDYDGRRAYDNYLNEPPVGKEQERKFVETNAPRMIKGVESIRNFVEYIDS